MRKSPRDVGGSRNSRGRGGRALVQLLLQVGLMWLGIVFHSNKGRGVSREFKCFSDHQGDGLAVELITVVL